ncbi:partial Neutral protease NprE, partial [uncultured bacterium]
FWLEGAGGDWLMGEDVFTPGTAGDALRSMSNPGGSEVPSGSRQPSTMAQYVNLPNTEAGDFGGVHTNSGIPNKAFHVFATSAGVTKEDAGKVYYRALTTYLTKNAQFVDCRLAVIKAAEDLFGGPGNAKALAAAAAFDAVGITSGAGTGQPPVDPPVQGTRYMAVIDAQTGQMFRWTIGTNSFAQLTAGALWSRPSVTDNGASLFYVDMQNNVHVVKSDGTGDQSLSTSGGFNNIAVSRSGRYLAATTVFAEPKIYVFDLQSSAGNKVLALHTPVYQQGETGGNIRYPDRIDWSADETRIMYDAYNTTVLTGGDTVGYWDINIVRVADGSIARLFPAQARGIDIGNAVYASNTDNLIAFDYSDATGQVQVLAVNLNTGDAGVVTNNNASLGCPSFSVDDTKVYYHYIDQLSNTYQVWSVTLGADGITGSGDDKIEVDGGVYPLAFAIGTRPTDVEEGGALPVAFGLDQNYPNPFNPTTSIGYQVPVSGHVRLAVYDMLGREVALLVDEVKAGGRHSVVFNAAGLSSGVYFYRMTVDGGLTFGQGYVQTRALVLVR